MYRVVFTIFLFIGEIRFDWKPQTSTNIHFFLLYCLHIEDNLLRCKSFISLKLEILQHMNFSITAYAFHIESKEVMIVNVFVQRDVFMNEYEQKHHAKNCWHMCKSLYDGDRKRAMVLNRGLWYYFTFSLCKIVDKNTWMVENISLAEDTAACTFIIS